jgi:two-component sensor histidine kinase
MNNGKVLLLWAVVVWFYGPVWGQEEKVDSLEQLLEEARGEGIREAEILLELSEVYLNTDPEAGEKKALAARQLLKGKDEVELFVKALNILGALSVKRGDLQSAKDNYDEAYQISLEHKMPIDQVIDAVKGKGTVASYTGNFEEALELYNEGLSICDSLGLLVQKADLLTNKSIVLQNQRKFEEALTLQKATWRLKKQLGVSKLELGKTLLGIANTFARMSQNDSASVYANQALSNFRDSGDQYGIALTFSAKGNIAQNLGKLEQAVACFDSARAYYTRTGNEQQVAISVMQAGSVMNTMQLSDQAAKYLKESLAILEKGQNKRALLFAYQSYANALSGTIDGEEGASARKVRDTVIFTNLKAAALANELGDRYNEGLTLSNLGLNYYRIEAYKEAVSALQKAIEIRKDQGLYNPYLTLGKCYLEMGMPAKAQRALMISDSLASQIDGLTNTAEYYKELSLAYEKLGMYAKSNKALFQYVDIRNQFYDENKAAAIAEIEERYQTEQKELQNQALQRENNLQVQINRNQRLGLGGLSLGLLALAGLSIFLYRQWQRIQAQKSEIELLHREQRHRMMNNLVFANSLMSLQVNRLKEQPEAQQAVKEADARLRAMSVLQSRLHHDGEGQKTVAIREYLEEITTALQRSFGSPEQPLRIHLHAPDAERVDGEAAMRIGLIVNELATNSCKHAFAEQPNPEINVALQPETEGHYRLIYTDNGSGLPADFQVDTKQSMGLFLLHNLVKQLNGRIAFSGEKGTRVECELDLKAA